MLISATGVWEMSGSYNIENALAAIAAANSIGIKPSSSLESLASYKGVRRRLEQLVTISNVTIYDDFAHHPTSIRKTIEAMQEDHSYKRIIVAIELRSNTMLSGLHNLALLESTKDADCIIFFQSTKIKSSLESEDLFHKNNIQMFHDTEALVVKLTSLVREGDALIFMSNGDFHGTKELLIKKLKLKFKQLIIIILSKLWIKMNIPLFPLQTVLFPGGPLSLRIFERRYLDMISECLRSNQLFGIVLNNQLPNSDEKNFCKMGTLAQIVDWDQGTDGVLGLKVIGNDRFLLTNYDQDENGLNIGEVKVIESEKKLLLPEEYMTLSSILKSILDEFSELYTSVKKDFNDASWVGYRLAEILPIELSQKQIYLEIEEPFDRLELLNTFMKANQEFLTLPKNSTLQ